MLDLDYPTMLHYRVSSSSLIKAQHVVVIVRISKYVLILVATTSQK